MLSDSSAGCVFSSFAGVALIDGRTTPLAASLHILIVSSSKTRGLVGNTIHPELFDVVFSSLSPAAIDVDKGYDVLVVWHPDLQTQIESNIANEPNQSVGWHLVVKINESTCTLSASRRHAE